MTFLLPAARFPSSPFACVRSPDVAWRTGAWAGPCWMLPRCHLFPASSLLCKPQQQSSGTAPNPPVPAGAQHVPHAPGPNPRPRWGGDSAGATCWSNPPASCSVTGRPRRTQIKGQGVFFGGMDATPLKQARPDLWLEKPRPVFRNQSNPG